MKTLTAVFASLTLFSMPVLAKTKVKKADAKTESAAIDTTASFLAWEGTKVTGKHNGKVKISKGALEIKDGNVVGGEVDIDMDSITTEDLTDATYATKLLNHLKSDDFFDVAKHPMSHFKIKSVKAKPSDKGTHEVTGDLTIKGTTKPLVFPATVTMDGNTVTAKGTAVVDRTLWNVRYGSGKFFKGLGDKVIHDNFTVAMDLTAHK